MKKSYLKRLVCLGAAALVLGSALAVAAVTGSPYETLKSALLNGIDIQNGTVKTEMSATLDGQPVSDIGESRTMYLGDEANLTLLEDGDFSYSEKGYVVSSWNGFVENGTDGPWYSAYELGDNGFHRSSFTVSPTERMSASERRFVELLADLLVGDLKNNISMHEQDGIRYITGTLTEAQIPELVDAGLDLICSEQTGYLDEQDYEDYRDAELPPPADLRLTYVHGDAQVDESGNLIALSGEVKLDYTDIYGSVRELCFQLGMEISDIGTTDPQCPIPGVQEALAEFRGEEAAFSSIRFQLDESGAIDRDTIFNLMEKNLKIEG